MAFAGGAVVCDEGLFHANEAPLMPGRRPTVTDKASTKAAAKWVWAPFKSSARGDGLELKHWAKGGGVEFADYTYARFNVKLEKIAYTDEEYDRVLADANWTRSDTDALMALCHRLDLRWPVIADRYEPIPARPLEQLQERYYAVAHALVSERERQGLPRNSTWSESSAALGISARSKNFDVAYEEKRQRQLNVAFCRTRAEEAEERGLRDELKAVELESRRLKKSAKASSHGADAERAKADPTKPALEDARAALVERSARRPVPGQPYLQSARLRVPDGSAVGLSRGMLHKLALILTELGLPERPTPTKLVCDAYDALRRDVIALLSLQKLANNKELELRQLREQLEASSRAASYPAQGQKAAVALGAAPKSASHKRKAPAPGGQAAAPSQSQSAHTHAHATRAPAAKRARK